MLILNFWLNRCESNSEKPFKTKVGLNIPYGYSRSKILAFDGKQNKHDVQRGQDCMKTNWKKAHNKDH